VKMVSKKDFREWNEAMVRRYNSEDYIFHSNFLIKFIEVMRFNRIKDLLFVIFLV
jgi:hypothetical protein